MQFIFANNKTNGRICLRGQCYTWNCDRLLDTSNFVISLAYFHFNSFLKNVKAYSQCSTLKVLLKDRFTQHFVRNFFIFFWGGGVVD